MQFFDAFSWINIRFLLDGLLVTVQVALFSILFSFVIGGLIGLVRFMKVPVASKLVGILTDIIRNLPLLLIIFFTYFALPQIGIRLSIFWASVAALTIFESAMLSEIIRAGLNAVPKGQMEAGRSTGLTYSQTLVSIIFPQAFKQMLPPIVSQFIALIKDTSLAVIISLPELTHNAKIIYGQDTNAVLPMFAAMAFLYFIVCYALSLVSKRLELRLAN
ncbi:MULTISPECIES: amino acid ABC transporter permease [Carnobacterium]|uniref:Amino ABC transporter, permease, 3-TM region,His/Glu/Gln/Arg/opine family domain protein n=2 Tax=Carnobacterium maltaromaticum TaxID=2751 RepID=K8EF97_CARML|nr:amino acid ABC transporter permease [Carnobacterium maltaromaticum]AOA01420.1 glutamine ABC transporter permease [Carnobacterium maltaromaticum]KRN60338.1 glutamine ABC transporter, permease protein [Carnobacterium maltaromaticum DSM 20342]KRN73848.1 glutamine ABC transporter, permease protein [Carnobacterium maltaromaticum]MBC9788917.1 ABC transporter permease subunit [Carnobacterium maltaromaticum]MBC9808266.1 ABC transporter permease subunit [Carnobacterium maltaromaticum]